MPEPTLPSEAGSISNADPSKPKNKKIYLYGAVGLVIGVGVYLYAKSKSSATATATVPNNGTTPTLVLPTGSGNSTASSVESSIIPYLQGIGSNLNTLLAQSKTGQDQNTAPPPITTGTRPMQPATTSLGTPLLPGTTFGTQSAQGSAWDVGQTIVGGNPYTLIQVPVGTTQQQEATGLYGNDPTGLATLQHYNPSGGSLTYLPVYPNEPVVG